MFLKTFLSIKLNFDYMKCYNLRLNGTIWRAIIVAEMGYSKL